MKQVDDEDVLYSGQSYVQITLLVIAVATIPWLFLFKPLYLLFQTKKEKKRIEKEKKEAKSLVDTNAINKDINKKSKRSPKDLEEANPADDEEAEKQKKSQEENEEEQAEPKFEAGEVWIHQAIHSIEFILGCISNTASYLRLWALSLAHSQLSYVFYDLLLVGSIGVGNFALIFVAFLVWGGITIGVLLMMESLSAFLHSLRLHWVEFQTKFYQGDGRAFTPFSFQTILKLNEEDQPKFD